MNNLQAARFVDVAKDQHWARVEFESEYEAGSDRSTSVVPQGTHTAENANAISSRAWVKDPYRDPKQHKVLLDIDLPVAVVESSTEGHHHLIIDKLVEWDHYVELLELLAKMGVIEEGYARAAIRRGATWVRAPWERKREPEPATPDNTEAVF